MGPIFALLHCDRARRVGRRSGIWLGLIFAISAWGVLRLLDAFVGRPRGVAHLVAAAFYLLNPYTVIFTGRTSIALLGYAALPWLLLIVLPRRARAARLARLVVGRRLRADPHLDRRRHQRRRGRLDAGRPAACC